MGKENLALRNFCKPSAPGQPVVSLFDKYELRANYLAKSAYRMVNKGECIISALAYESWCFDIRKREGVKVDLIAFVILVS